ncbi:MAG TPA: FecR domain-containing protein, partial [Stellaceae bacterium]|nr:FecR domain-containing protein [Stellaceae bacterium]
MAAMPRPTQVVPAIALALGLGLATPAMAQRVGVNSAVNPDATGTPPGAASRRLVLGQEVVHDEHVVTGGVGQTQILFLDESAMSVGPNSDLTIDNFVYDPSSGTGQLAMSATTGVMRFVGGKLSKNENAVTMRTPVGTIGVRGGVFLMNLTRSQKLDVVFLYGKGLTVTDGNVTQTITRPGFAVSVAGPGQPPSPPAPAPPNAVRTALAQFNGKSGATGGSSHPPTDATVAASGIGNDISGNLAASIQQAAQNASRGAVPSVNIGTLQANLNVNTVAPTGSSAVAQADQNPASQGASIGNAAGVAISGVVKNIALGTTTGFIDQSAGHRTPYTGFLDNGTVTGTASGIGATFTLSPLTPGATTSATGTASEDFGGGGGGGGSASGPAFLTSDSDFFFANLTSTGDGSRVFVFGGVPVQQSFYAATPTPQFLAFNVQPDFALGGSGTQTIPFLPSFAGGTQSNAVVSPLYLVTQPNQAFGNFNLNTNPNGNSPHFLQASLGINGQGANQTSALSILTGSFFTSSDTGAVAASGPIRATFLGGGASPLTHVTSGSATVPDANGNNLFGGATIDGFVLDSNKYNNNLNFVQDTSNAFTIGPGNTSTRYAFNQPVLAGSLPAGVGATRTGASQQGYFGGIMTNGRPFQYVLTGAVALQTFPSNSTLSAVFAGSDPFTSNTTGIGTLVLPFGTASGRNFSRSTFIDDNIFAAADNATQGVQLTATNGTTTTYPTDASGATTFPALGLISSGVVPGAANGLLPPGAAFCACQFLHWGYWEANIPAVNNGGPTNTVQSSYINTWLAGQPTVTLPTSGVGSFNGAAIGTVSNNGAVYLAAGGFSQTY